MTSKQKTTQDTQNLFDLSACMAMIEKMMGDDCAEMMSHVKGQAEIPEEWLEMMSQMMDIHCRPREKANMGS